jgi:hypothetical protein
MAPCFLVLAGCHQVMPTILVNSSGTDIVVRYVMLRWEIEPGKLARCRFDSDPPLVASTVVSGSNWSKAKWAPIENARFDREICAAEHAVKAGTSVWIETNGICSDYQKFQKRNPALRPTLESLVVAFPTGRIELRSWDVAKPFKRRSGGACIFDVGHAEAAR